MAKLRLELSGHAAPGGERLEHDHRVRDGHILEILVPRLERLEHGLDRLDVRDRVLGGDERQRVGDVVGKPSCVRSAVGRDAQSSHSQHSERSAAA